MKRPHRFKIEIIPAFSIVSPIRYEFLNGNLRVEFRGLEQRFAMPTKHQWSGFWRLCDFLDLWNWLPDYEDGGTSRDGQSWQIDIAFSKSKRVQSKGNNWYPSLEDAKIGIATMDRFVLLLHFIDISLMTPRPDQRDDFGDYTISDS
ncbi:MAG: hypothetical protein KDA68_08835 [Planctomycetaceae bacterium]|nr:hypothetical protein [Planctomycetaceae bacterium]